MKILGMNFGADKNKPISIPTQNIPPVVIQDNKSDSTFGFASFAAQSDIPPANQYIVRNGMVMWGNDNLYPLQLADLYTSSPIHSSIVDTKVDLMIGKGIQYKNFSGLTVEQQAELLRFSEFANGSDKSLVDISYELALDYQVFGGIALEVIWDMTFTKIVMINRIPIMNLRIEEELPNGKIPYFLYNKDWVRPNFYGTTQIPAFDINNKTNTNQIIYVKNPSLTMRGYGIPTYASGIKWIKSDAAISSFHLNNISNGMSPSLKVQFYKKPETQEQMDKEMRKFQRDYTSEKNAGRAMIFFSDGKDEAPDVEPIQVSNIDKQFTVIADQIVCQILRAHRGVSGILFGIATSGNKLSLAGEYESAFKIFEQTVISSDRKVIEKVFNKILQINGIDAGLYFNPYQIFNAPMGMSRQYMSDQSNETQLITLTSLQWL